MKLPTERNFGLTVGAILCLIGLAPLRHGLHIRYVPWLLGLFLLGAAVAAPGILYFPNRAWMKLGELLSKITSPIVLGVLFFGVLTPFAWLARRFGKTGLALNLDGHSKSYWIERENPPADMKLQF